MPPHSCWGSPISKMPADSSSLFPHMFLALISWRFPLPYPRNHFSPALTDPCTRCCSVHSCPRSLFPSLSLLGSPFLTRLSPMQLWTSNPHGRTIGTRIILGYPYPITDIDPPVFILPPPVNLLFYPLLIHIVFFSR